MKPLKPLAPRKKLTVPSKRTRGSSIIAAHAYDPKERTLTVTFHGGNKYRYNNVRPETAEGLTNAPSKGSYLHSRIIGKHDATKI